MWTKPYTLREGTAIAAGLALTGLLLQLTVGPVEWAVFAWPANIVVLALLVAALVAMWLLRARAYLLRFVTTMAAAVPAIALAAALTIVMGLTRQVGDGQPPADPIGLTRMLGFWPFVLAYLWLAVIVGEVAIKQLAARSWRRVPSLVSHAGLFVVIVCGTLGAADMQRLKMYCETGKPEWRGLDAQGTVHELPVALQLDRFTIDEYPPKLMVVDGGGLPLPHDKPQQLLVDRKDARGTVAGWTIRVERYLDPAIPAMFEGMAAQMPEGMMGHLRMDSLGMARNRGGYVASRARGAACALLVTATRGRTVRSGWVSCGSYRFPYQALRLDSAHTLAMPQREPRRYASTVEVYTQGGDHLQAEVEVNRPLKVAGWDVYQLSYDEQKGKWSDVSVFELVRDPWLPVVYVGIFMLLAGAVGMFLTSGRGKEAAL